MSLPKCPICSLDADIQKSNTDIYNIDCGSCGSFSTTGSVLSSDYAVLKDEWSKRAAVRYAIRRMQSDDSRPLIKSYDLDRLIETATLPSPVEQMENLLIHIAKETGQYFGQKVLLAVDSLAGVIGCFDGGNVKHYVHHLKEENLIQVVGKGDLVVQLTMDGWLRYDELMRTRVDGRRAFMAMPFNNKLLDRVFQECFKPAVAETGFILERVDSNPEAGAIDSKIKVDIRRSRFLICECAYDNSGAYFEAGFADGLGRPVIYTLDKSWLDADPDNNRVHFDVRQSMAFYWEHDKLDEAANLLKSIIRNTFPDEADLGD